MRIDMRWMVRRDMPDVLDIESSSFEFPRSEDDFVNSLRQCRTSGMVAEHGDRVVGFVIYELHTTSIVVVDLAVHPDYRRAGVGAFVVERLKRKLGKGKRNTIQLEIVEDNLDAQLFFRSQGFEATAILRDKWRRRDAYEMVYSLDGHCPANRIRGMFHAADQ